MNDLESKSFGEIYCCTNKVNNKSYIGQSIFPLEKRIKQHINDVKNNKGNSYFHNALREYGIENFKWEILCECPKELLNIMETFYIIKNKSHVNEGGYNLTWGGDGTFGYRHTDETKMKISEKNKGNKKWLGKTHTDETKKKLSDVRKNKRGWKHTDETKEKISKSHTGFNHTDETKIKMSEHSKGKNKKKFRIIYDDGKIEIIIGLKQWCEENNIVYNTIRHKRRYKNIKIERMECECD